MSPSVWTSTTKRFLPSKPSASSSASSSSHPSQNQNSSSSTSTSTSTSTAVAAGSSGSASDPSLPSAAPLSSRNPQRRLFGGVIAASSHSRSKSHHLDFAHPRPAVASTPRRGHKRSIAERRSEGDLLSVASSLGPDVVSGNLVPTLETTPRSGQRDPQARMPDPQASAVEPAQGQCMCCDSTLRYPAHLDSFRCTICMTINDLRPSKPSAACGETSPVKSTPPISLDQIRSIISSSRENFLRELELLPLSDRDHLKPLTPPPRLPPLDLPVTTLSPEPEPAPPAASSSDAESAQGTLSPPSRSPPPPPVLLSSAPSVNLGHAVSNGSGRRAGSSEIARYRELAAQMFKPLEDHLSKTFSKWDCLNWSFLEPSEGGNSPRNARDERELFRANHVNPIKESGELLIPATDRAGEREALMLTLGRVVKQELDRDSLGVRPSQKERSKSFGCDRKLTVRSPGIDWNLTNQFYDLVLGFGLDIIRDLAPPRRSMVGMGPPSREPSPNNGLRRRGPDLLLALEDARSDFVRSFLRVTEGVLKRPGRPLKKPEESRFLLIILANPLLYPGASKYVRAPPPRPRAGSKPTPKSHSSSRDILRNGPSSHPGILRRVFGLLSNLPNECHHFLISWFSIMPEKHFQRMVDLGGSFTTYRISKYDTTQRSRNAGIIAKLSYSDDWQLKSTAKVMQLLFAANNNTLGRRKGSVAGPLNEVCQSGTKRKGQIVPVSAFYNMRLDYCDLVADFEAWENKAGRFSFCQHPLYLSMGAKIQILEHDARRQMEVRARNAFITNISNRTSLSQYMVLKVRRECLVEDSLKGISESIGTIDDIKKGLKVEFMGEDGIDAGGLRKEWFLLVARDVFDPNYGLFVYDEDSRYCYFNPYSFESTEEFYLVGVLIGLAIYNSTILDIALPPYVFKKLMHNSPAWTSRGAAENKIRPPFRRTLEDLAILRPALARGLQQLLDFDGDVQETFCRDFVAESDRFGEKVLVPLCPNGENRAVTNSNRKEFVDLYVKHLLDTSVTRQFEPFKRGFYYVCGGNALSLFSPDEIELLVRGSEEPLDMQALQAVAVYDGWGEQNPAESDPVVKWFWQFFAKSSPQEQRQILSFITGSDRIPAMGATNLTIKVVCLGADCERFPVARTCFNQICLWRYKRRDKLERMLWTAVTESEGFGLK